VDGGKETVAVQDQGIRDPTSAVGSTRRFTRKSGKVIVRRNKHASYIIICIGEFLRNFVPSTSKDDINQIYHPEFLAVRIYGTTSSSGGGGGQVN